jgi:hypothetical protein
MRAKAILRPAQDDFSLDTNQPFQISAVKDTLPEATGVSKVFGEWEKGVE